MLRRRTLLVSAGATLLTRCAPRASSGQILDFVIPYASGGGFDAYVRAVLPALQSRLGFDVVPDNVDGAGGARAANLLFRGKPDGSMISVVNVPGAMILQQQGGLGCDLTQLTWLGNMGRDSYGLIVPASSPVRSIDDLRRSGTRRPVKFTCIGPAGTAYSATRIGTKLLGIRSTVIPGYKGTNDYIVAAIRGDGEAAIASLTALHSFVKAGMVRVLATFEEKGSLHGVPDAIALGLPELADIVQLRPVAGPPALPAPVAARLSSVLVSALKDPGVVAWAKKNHANLKPDDAAETARLLQQQGRFIDRWKGFLAAT